MHHTLQQTIADNLAQVRDSIANAAHHAGRRPEAVRLVAVSKTQPAEAVAAAVAAGQRVFGENTVQDALTKIPHFAGDPLEWHFIGHLQSNKVKFIPGNFSWVHSLDSLKLAQRLSRIAEEKRIVISTLIEVNIIRDPAKHGVDPDAVSPLMDVLLHESLPGLALRGLMAIGPHDGTETELRATFSALRRLRDSVATQHALPAFTELSMGMSGDYVEAIAEGATLVRIGSAIFGDRSGHR